MLGSAVFTKSESLAQGELGLLTTCLWFLLCSKMSMQCSTLFIYSEWSPTGHWIVMTRDNKPFCPHLASSFCSLCSFASVHLPLGLPLPPSWIDLHSHRCPAAPRSCYDELILVNLKSHSCWQPRLRNCLFAHWQMTWSGKYPTTISVQFVKNYTIRWCSKRRYETV